MKSYNLKKRITFQRVMQGRLLKLLNTYRTMTTPVIDRKNYLYTQEDADVIVNKIREVTDTFISLVEHNVYTELTNPNFHNFKFRKVK